ncbi:MAG: hypothetical protein ABH840_00755 [Nanoarchaeota archaeon]
MIKPNQSEGVSKNVFILVLVFFILALALLIFSVIYFGVLGKTTGFAVGYVNLTISTQITLNVTNNSVLWGAGSIDSGATNTTLRTQGAAGGNVTNGNWSGTTALALVVENIGSVNASITLQSGKNASNFLGGTLPEYQWNVSNRDSGACGATGEAFGQFKDVNVSGAAIVCTKLDFHSGKRAISIDFRLVIPYDVNSTIANGVDQTDIITITGSA